MVLLIDGYNLLKYILKKAFATDKERAMLVSQLETYARAKGHSIILVFDGGSFVRPTYTKRGQVAIAYSGVNESADDVIKEYVKYHPASQLIIVSSDRAVYVSAARAGVTTIDAQAFYTLMRETKSPALKIKKASGMAQKLHPEEKNEELDALMQEASSVLLYKEETPQEGHTQKHDKLSKEERRLLKITRKL